MRTRRPPKGWAVAIILLCGVSAVLWFAEVSWRVSSFPPADEFPGWVAVLSRGLWAEGQVTLSADALEPGASGTRPGVTYTVAACGPRRFEGVLLLGGAARLDELKRPGAGARNIADLRVYDVATGMDIPLGPVQSIPVALRSTRCASRFSRSGEGVFTGAATDVTGHIAAPLRRKATGLLGLWDGSREAQTWPLVGTMPGIARGALGVFRFSDRSLAGNWARPLHEYLRVSVAASFTNSAQVELARPDLARDGSFAWSGTAPFEPHARLVNEARMAALQQQLIAATIWLAIAGSLVASLLFAWLRPQPAAAVAPADREAGRSRGFDMLALVVLAFASIAKRRRQ